MNEVYICSVIDRWKGCVLQKNFCCGECQMLESCLRKFKINPKNKIKPCSYDMSIDCEYKEAL